MKGQCNFWHQYVKRLILIAEMYIQDGGFEFKPKAKEKGEKQKQKGLQIRYSGEPVVHVCRFINYVC